MQLGFLWAILSPIFFGLVDVFDKYVVERRSKNAYAFAVMEGIGLIVLSLIAALFLDWSEITASMLPLPIFVGIIFGVNSWFYYHLLKHEDVSYVIGLQYFYPVIVAALSYVFLAERIPFWGYVGVLVTVIGTLLLSIRIHHVKFSVITCIIMGTIFLAIGEFSAKVVTDTMPEFHAAVIDILITGIILAAGLLVTSIRSHVREETHNYSIACVTATLYGLYVLTLYLAMADLPATIVSAFAAIQPLFVLVLENIVDRFIGKIARDHRILPKLVPIALIVCGLILLYMS